MPVNSTEIAARAGVSQATVSRVINNSPTVRQVTRQRVLDAIAEAGYVPNAEARSLVTNRPTKVGLVVSDITNPFFPELVESIAALARDRGYAVLLCNTQRDPSNEQTFTRFLLEQRVAGVLFAAITPSSTAPYQLAQAGIPCVFLNRHLRGSPFPSVLTDNVAGAYQMTEYLLSMGHTRIAFVRGLPDASTSEDREEGYRRCLADHGFAVNAVYQDQGEYTRAGAYAATERLLRLPVPPTAIFCANDYMAFGVLDAAADLGREVPGDLSVVGFDNIALASLRCIGLTTVEQPIGEMARRAMEILLTLVETGPARPGPWVERYEARIVVRRTSGPPPLGGRPTQMPAEAAHTRNWIPVGV